jgi:enoyl-CoA hydratase
VPHTVHTAWSATSDGGHHAVLTVDRSDRLNIVGAALLDQLRDAIETCGRQADLRAVVLRGAGERAFIGGADIGEMAHLDSKSARTFITRLHACCAALRGLPVPVIARLQGFTLGAGLEIAAACDLRIAAADARFGMPEVRVGIPSVIEAALLPMLIGWGRTRWLLMTGDIIDAGQAERWGLVEKVVAPDALDAAIVEAVAMISACGPAALAAQKRLIRQWEDLPPARAIAAGIDAFADAFRSDEPRRMMRAFLDRKKG